MSVYWNLLNKVINLIICKCIGFLKWDDGSFVLVDDEKVFLMNLYFVMIGKKLVEEF